MKTGNKLFLIGIAVLYITFHGILNSSFAGEASLSWTPPTTNVDGTTLTDLAGYKVYYGTSSGSYSSILDVGNVTAYTLTNLTENITYFFAVTAYDTAGNESNFSSETSKTIPIPIPPDLISPTGTVSINNDAVYTNTSNIILTLSCTDNDSGCRQMQFSEDNISWSKWEAFSSNKTFTFSSGEGAKNIYVKFQDNAGNISVSCTDSIIVDKTPPSGTSSINSGATYATTSWITITPSCSDNLSGCSLMRISNDNIAWTWFTWKNVSNNKDWQVPNGDGVKVVYIQYRDKAGNYSIKHTAAITLDTTSPIISGIASNNITTNQLTISWTSNEPATSHVEYGTSNLYGTLSNPDNNLTISHTVVLSGLTPDTTYYFRVRSIDQAGNQGISTGYTFTTLRNMQPEIPAPIMDMSIMPALSTKNSVTINWTATGADGTVGTATAYDLRMSRFRIIEDGITPKQGEINFSIAPKITGVIYPAPAGTVESFQVNQLVPNSVYFFAIKAIDEKGNVSAISNVINGNNFPALPVTALRNGYTAISIPLTTQTSDAQTLLSGIVGSPVEVYSWMSYGITNGGGSFTTATNIIPGNGYLLKSNTNNAILNVTGTVITDPTRTIPLNSGWNMIGNPYPLDIPLINTYIKNIGTGEIKTYKDAVIAGWVSNALYTYNGSTYSFVLYDTAALKIWQGYWISVILDGQYELVINKP
ncbi:MAG: fibronectin type III domain-containing protein [Nitrospirae bacterium]|nr:fibronectin type III domain-containing protein [Nitrospirota bacterium]